MILGVTWTGVAGTARRALARIAADAPVRAFVIRGVDSPADPAMLRLCEEISLLESPRSATVLLIAGSVSPALHDAVEHVHDQMAHPRATLNWTRTSAAPNASTQLSGATRRTLPGDTTSTPVVRDVSAAMQQLQRALITGRRTSEPDILPHTSRSEWQGVGPYDQGGSGMTGGVPYGRPMAERAAARDGLELDQLPLRIGPYFDPFPAGLILDVLLQGDVLQQVEVSASPLTPLTPVFVDAMKRPVRIDAVELARSSYNVRWLAHALRVQGLAALGLRALRLAAAISNHSDNNAAHATSGDFAANTAAECMAVFLNEFDAIRAAVERSGVLRSTRGVGVIHPDMFGDYTRQMSSVARAAGIDTDARAHDGSYRALRFSLVSTTPRDGNGRCDVSARWRQRLAETRQSLELATLALRSGAPTAWGDGVVEGPLGLVTTDSPANAAPEAFVAELLPDLLKEMEWGDAVATIVSLALGDGGSVTDVRPWTAATAIEEAAKQPDSGMNEMAHDITQMSHTAQMNH